MSGYCRSCGVPIPKGQTVCSMCYGDPFYGRDGYYLSYLEDTYEKYAEEQAMMEEMMAWEEASEKDLLDWEEEA